MPAVFRPWISPYGDEDFEWNRRKSLETFADRDLVFEAARIVFRSTLLRRQDTRRRRSKEPRFMVLGELYGRVVVAGNAVSSRCGRRMPWSVKYIMSTRPLKPKEYFQRLLDLPEDQIDYTDSPPTTAADWEDAEVLFPVTPEEFHAIKKFILTRREQDSGVSDHAG
jgi:uncharacterized DUF497 family protein